MSELHTWLDGYNESHQNPRNVLLHWICVPLIVWAVIALLWLIPVPRLLGTTGLWAGLAMVAAIGFYLRLSKPLALAMFVVFAVVAFITHWLYQTLGASNLLWTAIGVFVLAWIGQFIGHEFEGKRPSFVTDLFFLLIGPLWLMVKLLRRFGVNV